MHTDVLIIGSGIAGLAFAIKLAERKPKANILLVTKGDRFESNTKYAQGGIAAVMDNLHSSYESHINDTLKAGKGFSNILTVRLVVEKAAQRLQELMEWGASFDKTSDGNWDYGLEGGHSVARILHYKDQTGLALEKALLKQLGRFENIRFQTEIFATQLLVKNNCCHGARFLDKKGQPRNIQSKITYLATGGSGQVFSKTTNPLIATGDGLAMASRAGAGIEQMAFYQFHPTALVTQDNPVFLITEALRGAGAHLLNHLGERFSFNYHPDVELATRDVLSMAIFKEMLQTGKDEVWLDCTHLEKRALKKHFPNIIGLCRAKGIDLFKEYIPVAPAAHYQCGGIIVNREGKTSIDRLYANGECAATGMHGANRLASNSLLEAVVFAHEAALSASTELFGLNHIDGFRPEEKECKKPSVSLDRIKELRSLLQELMYRFCLNQSLNLRHQPLEAAVNGLISEIRNLATKHKESKALWELQNIAETARLIIEDTLYE